MPLLDPYDRLLEQLAHLDSVLVAYSGGVDSTLLAVASQAVLGDRAIAVHAASDMMPPGETEHARALAADLGLQYLEIETYELADPRVTANSPERCYYCKGELFEQLRRVADVRGLEHIADGANADDLDDHRPGHRAAREWDVVSPLQLAGMTKSDVRDAARALGLPNWDRPSMACLASRIPYGTPVTDEAMTRIARAEGAVADLGFGTVRVRAHGDVARIEIAEQDLGRAFDQRTSIAQAVRSAGFPWVALDLDGYRTGSMNDTLADDERESHTRA